MACSNYWTSPFQVGSHQIARGLVAAGYTVGFVSDPISPLHVAAGLTPTLAERYRLSRGGGEWFEDNRLWAYVPRTLLAPTGPLDSAWTRRNWHRLTLPSIHSMIAAAGFGSVELLIFDNARHSYLLDEIDARRSVFRVADYNPGFGGPSGLPQWEAEFARRVDAVAYTALSLADHVAAMKPKESFHLPNGVALAHFANPAKHRPAEYEKLPGPIAVYVGAMESWFDFELVNQAVDRLPEVSFVLIGPDGHARRRLAPADNLHLLGPRPHQSLPAYLQFANVGMIPFDVGANPELVHRVNPLKLYEYLASGLPVVSVEWEELRLLDSPACLCRTPDQFVTAIQQTIKNPPPADMLRGYAARHDWAERVRTLTSQIPISRAA